MESPLKMRQIHRIIAQWYALHGRRDLPWRTTRDAYRIYISEIMLQQTQVKTVLERYYAPFLKRFPTLGALAAAPLEEVIKQWEGLGYYTRAANLHKAAKQAAGVLPGTPEALHLLPGIGRNTANAVACFGFGKAVPVMEANVRRVLCRVFALKKADETILWEKAELLLDKENPFDYNQAMMDIGALICTRHSPRCGECPLAAICRGKDSPEAYPAAVVKKAVPVRKRSIVVFEQEGRFLLQRRETRFLGGLYGFPEYEAKLVSVEMAGRAYTLKPESLLGAITQVYSHFRLEAKVYHIALRDPPPQGMTLADFSEMERLPLSRADHKVVGLLEAFKACPLKTASRR